MAPPTLHPWNQSCGGPPALPPWACWGVYAHARGCLCVSGCVFVFDTKSALIWPLSAWSLCPWLGDASWIPRASVEQELTSPRLSEEPAPISSSPLESPIWVIKDAEIVVARVGGVSSLLLASHQLPLGMEERAMSGSGRLGHSLPFPLRRQAPR